MRVETIVAALGGRRVGRGWIARCPAHDDRKPSLAIQEGEDEKVLVKCHAGCEQAQVIDALRARGLWSDGPRSRSPFRPRPPRSATDPTHHTDVDRTTAALRIWHDARTASGTPVEHYLRSRGIELPTPPALRFHPALPHPCGRRWPAIVALVTRGTDETPVAIHRTFLAEDGARKAPLEPQKMMLGPCRGAAVRLAASADVLMVGEGIETCLAVMQATGQPSWAALSTAGLRSLNLPPTVREVIVLADGDDAGETAAVDAARRWTSEGRRVRIARPGKGLDFNDLLCGRAFGTPGGMA